MYQELIWLQPPLFDKSVACSHRPLVIEPAWSGKILELVDGGDRFAVHSVATDYDRPESDRVILPILLVVYPILLHLQFRSHKTLLETTQKELEQTDSDDMLTAGLVVANLSKITQTLLLHPTCL